LWWGSHAARGLSLQHKVRHKSGCTKIRSRSLFKLLNTWLIWTNPILIGSSMAKISWGRCKLLGTIVENSRSWAHTIEDRLKSPKTHIYWPSSSSWYMWAMLSTCAWYKSNLRLGGMYDTVRKIVFVGPARDTQSWSSRESSFWRRIAMQRGTRRTAIKTPPPVDHRVLTESRSLRNTW